MPTKEIKSVRIAAHAVNLSIMGIIRILGVTYISSGIYDMFIEIDRDSDRTRTFRIERFRQYNIIDSSMWYVGMYVDDNQEPWFVYVKE